VQDLRDLAKRQNRLFAGSTSSLTGMLSHCYFLMSDHKEVDISSLSQAFSREVTGLPRAYIYISADPSLAGKKLHPGATHARLGHIQLQGRRLRD
jgi:hypothetical protein